MTKAELLRLPAILDGFNGLYAERDGFAITHQPRGPMALGLAAFLILVLAIALVRWLVRRWRSIRRGRALAPV